MGQRIRFRARPPNLLDNGNILRPAKIKPRGLHLRGAGDGGRIQEFTWDGELVWDFKFHNDTQLPHHDICRMPNGNILMMVWNRKTAEESHRGGRKPIRRARRDGWTTPSSRSSRPARPRRSRLGMARLGPPDSGPRQDQGQLRRRRRASRVDRHQLRAEQAFGWAAAGRRRSATTKNRRTPRTNAKRRPTRQAQGRIGYVGAGRTGRPRHSAPTGRTSTPWPTTPSSTRSW